MVPRACAILSDVADDAAASTEATNPPPAGWQPNDVTHRDGFLTIVPAVNAAYLNQRKASRRSEEVKNETKTSMPDRSTQMGPQAGCTGRAEISRLSFLRQDS